MRHETIALPFEPRMLRTHNGTLTLLCPSTGESVVIRIKTQSKDARFKPGERMLSVYVGPDEHDFEPFAFVYPGGDIQVWTNKRGTAESPSKYDVLADMIKSVTACEDLEGMLIGACRACNMPLRSTESVMAGIGPECSKKHQREVYDEAAIPF